MVKDEMEILKERNIFYFAFTSPVTGKLIKRRTGQGLKGFMDARKKIKTTYRSRQKRIRVRRIK